VFERVAQLLSVRTSERSFVTLSALLAMAAMGLNVLVLGTVTALFLSVSTRAQLPLVYVAGAVFGVVASALLGMLGSSASRAREVAAVLVLLGVVLLGAFVALPFAPPAFLFVLHPVATGLSALAVVQAFALVSDCLDAEQAKRLLPAVGAGGTLGAMAAGGLMALLATTIGTDRALVPAALLAVVAAVLARRLVKTHLVKLGSAVRAPGAFADLVAEHMAPKVKPFQEVLRSPLLRTLAVLQLLVLAGSTCLKFALESSLQAQLGVDHIARFLGLLNLAANGAILVIQTSLEGRLLKRYGLWFGLFAMPAILLGGASLLLVSSGLAMLATVRFGETIARFSVARTAEDLLLLPLASVVRRRGKTFLASTVAPVSVLLGSLLIMSVDAYGASLAYVVTLLLGAAAAVVVQALRGRYIAQLRDELSRRAGVTTSRTTQAPLEPLGADVIAKLSTMEGTPRRALLRTLLRHRLHGTSITLPAPVIQELITTEVRVGHWLRVLKATLAGSALSPLKARCVAEELAFHEERTQETLFLLLAVAYAPDDMHRAHMAYRRGDRRVKAFAIEVVEHTASAGVRKELTPYLASATDEEQLVLATRTLQKHVEQGLGDLLRDPSLPKRLRPLALYLSFATPQDSEEAGIMTTLDQSFTLRNVELFSRLGPEELRAVAEISEPARMSQGQRVFAEGDAGDALYVVMSGELQVVRSGAKIATLKAGECFGEMAVLDQGLRTATVTALTDCELRRIGDEDFRELLERTPGIAISMLAILARRVTSPTRA
jgi:Cyclic nucleotide-binding domain